MPHWRSALDDFLASPPLEAEDLTLQTRFLRGFILFMVVAGLGFAGAFVILEGLWPIVLVSSGILGIMLVLRWRLTPKNYRQIGLALCIAIVISVTLSLYLVGDFTHPGVLGYFVALVLVSHLAEARWVLLVGLLIGGAIFWLHSAIVIPPQLVATPMTSFELLVILGLLTICTLLLAIGTQALLQSYQRLHAQQALLAQRVAERTATLTAANAALREAQATLAQRVAEHTAHLELEVAERQRAQAALQQSENLYRQLIAHIPQAILINNGHHYIFGNPAALAQLRIPDLNTLQQLRPMDLVDLEGLPRLQERHAQLQNEVPHLPPMTYQVRALDGHRVHVEVTSHRVMFAGQRVTLTISTDITTRLQAQQAQRAKEVALAANRAKSAFLANMSHELRTPLTAIIGYAEVIFETAVLGSRAQARAAKVLETAQSLLTLINDILDYSKIEAGKLELNYETFPLPWLIEAILMPLQTAIAKQQNTLQVQLAPDLSPITADLLRVRQILANLLNNAIRFTRNGQIQLQIVPQARGTQPGVVFTIADTGVGIEPKRLTNLFQAFQHEVVMAQGTEGTTGLGLAICHQLCHLHGGEIKVQSTVGQGTTFTVWLPQKPS